MSYLSTILADTPQAYYRCNESSGTVANDSSGNGYNGKLSGVSAYSQAGAIVGDVSSASILFTAAGGLALPYTLNPLSWSAATLEFWANITGTWHHVVVAVDATSEIFYLDGSVTTPGSGVFTSIFIDSILDAAGSFINATRFDEVAIYNYKLSAIQVITHYKVGTGQSVSSGYTVTIGGQFVFVEAGTLTVDNTIGKRSQASFTVKHDIYTHFQEYQQCSIYDQTGTLVFSGYLTQPKEQYHGYAGNNYLISTIQCIDQHWLADKRLVAATYVNKTVGYIAQDIMNNILAQEGVTRGQIYDGLTPSTTLYPATTLYPGGNVGLIPQATFYYCKVSDALDALVKQASSAGVPYYWMIDQNKNLWVVPYTAVVNSTIIDGTQIDGINNAATVTRSNPSYRNTEYMLGGVAQTVTQNVTIVGDGNKRDFPLGYALASAPTIVISGVTQTVGLKGTTGSQWYWAQGDNIITQDTGQTILANGATGNVSYTGQYPNTSIISNAAQISYQASLDGTTGIVEVADTDTSLTTASNAFTEASALLQRYGMQGVLLQFTTRQTGFAPGQLVTVNLPMHSLNNVQMLIEEVSASDQVDGLNIWFTVKAIIGAYDVTWQDFFSKLLAQQTPANSINIGSTNATSILVLITAAIAISATLTVNVYACPIPNTTLFPSTTLYPC